MKSKSIFLLALVLGLFLTACTRRFYKTDDFEEKSRRHKIIAVLPYEIQMTGRLPKELTEDLKRKIEDAESVAFQRNLYDQLHLIGGRGRRDLTVKIQPVDRTNELLTQSGIDIRESWTRDPQKLAELLGVDAVVRAKASKQRYLSDLESLGVSVGMTVLGSVFGVAGFGGLARTSDVEVSASILDAKSGEALFAGRDECSVNWSWPANEAIERINERISRRFPYVD
jgi:hypothetical protein